MKTLNELLAEKEGYYNNFLKLDATIQEFNKPTTLNKEEFKQYKAMIREGKEEEANNYYTQIKEITDANKQELNELKRQKDVFKLAYNLIDVNIITVFSSLYKDKIINILNEFINKRVGEKTEIKIKNELKEIDENINYIYIKYNGSFASDNYVYIYFSNFNIEIEFSKINSDSWLNEKGELIQDISNYITNTYSYIDNILQLATEKVEEKKQLEEETEKEIKRLKEKIENFNSFYCGKQERYFKIDEYNIFR